MPNTASGIRHVARSSGDHMQVEMKHRLPGRRPVIEANVEPVGTIAATGLGPSHGQWHQ